MNPIDLSGFLIFAFLTSVTPGPNNLLLFGLGKSIGFRNTIPAMAGIFCGFSILLIVCGYGLAAVTFQRPGLEHWLKIIASIWLIYLAFILRNLGIAENKNITVKIGFFHALLMQFINPKAWFMGINGATAFLPKFSSIHLNVSVFVLGFAVVGVPAMILWTSSGNFISRLLLNPKQNRLIGNLLFVLMLLTVVTLFL